MKLILWSPDPSTVPGVTILTPGIAWFPHCGTLAVYPSLMPVRDRLVAYALSVLGYPYLLKCLFRHFVRKYPERAGEVKQVVALIKEPSSGKRKQGYYWYVGSSARPEECLGSADQGQG